MRIDNNLCKPVAISIEKLHPFEDHPYKVLDNEEMEALAESIHTEGILSPLIVRPLADTDEYEVISGHRRLHAAQRAGLSKVPVLVCEISREEAVIMLVDSNLHREHILPSEKAFAYKLKMVCGSYPQKRPLPTARRELSWNPCWRVWRSIIPQSWRSRCAVVSGKTQ